MQLVKEGFKILNLPIIDETLTSNEVCIMDKQTFLIYIREIRYKQFGQCEIHDRLLEEVTYNQINKTITINN